MWYNLYKHKGDLKNMEKQRGAVSIFIVLFATMLFVAISIGFAIFMMRDQDRATDNDLARSALDSAQAGVEDAKRVLAKYNDCIERDAKGAECSELINRINSDRCDTVAVSLGGDGDRERLIKQSNDDEKLQQAYTCVKITPNTDDVIKAIKDEGDIKFIPLRGVENFDVVEIEWSKKTEGSSYDFSKISKSDELNNVLQVKNASSLVDAQLPRYDNWKESWGSLVRAQFISYDSNGLSLNGLDSAARTAFLYPDTSASAAAAPIDLDEIDKHTPPSVNENADRLDAAFNKPVIASGTKCNSSVANGEYMCRAQIKRPSGGNLNYLTLSGVYAKGGQIDIRVTIKKRADDGSLRVVKFDNVQPKVDATGRANNEFRRIEVRVEATPSEDAVPLPRATIAVNGNLCKSFTVTDSAGDFQSNGCSRTDTLPERQP